MVKKYKYYKEKLIEIKLQKEKYCQVKNMIYNTKVKNNKKEVKDAKDKRKR